MEGQALARLDSVASCSHRCYGDSHASNLPVRKRLRRCTPRQKYSGDSATLQQLKATHRKPSCSPMRATSGSVQQISVFLEGSSSRCQLSWSPEHPLRSRTVVARVAAPERAEVRLMIWYIIFEHSPVAKKVQLCLTNEFSALLQRLVIYLKRYLLSRRKRCSVMLTGAWR